MHDEKTGPQTNAPVTPGSDGPDANSSNATAGQPAEGAPLRADDDQAAGGPEAAGASGGDAGANVDQAFDVGATAAGAPRPGKPLSRWSVEEALTELNAQLKTELEESEGKRKYLAADLDNARKRAEREKADTARFAISKFAEDILPLADTIQRAMALVPADAIERDEALKRFVDGVMMIEGNLLSTLERHGIQRLYPLGEKFDPNRHQAVMEDAHPDIPKGHVSMVHQAGYMISDRVLRTAMVSVSNGQGAGAAAASATAGATPAAADPTAGQADPAVAADPASPRAANDDEAPRTDARPGPDTGGDSDSQA